jgi:predicted transcriptional regulator
MAENPLQALSRRERQIMDVIYQRGQATVAEVREGMSDPPSYSAVRTLLGILEGKGMLTHAQDGIRYVYRPTQPREAAAHAALARVLRTFYHGSVSQTVAALLETTEGDLAPEELDELARLIARARTEGR